MLFIILELICLNLIRKNNYHNEAISNSSNAIVGWTIGVVGKVGDFFDQTRQTEDLAQKYAEQTTLLFELRQKEEQFYLSKLDESKIYQYKFIPAKVSKNSISSKTNNFITIDKGTEQGVRPGMGVISPDGLIGIVYSSSDNFSKVTSVLHSKQSFSGRIKSNQVIGKIKWDGEDSRIVNLLDVLRHERFIVGDTVETSGFGAIFPPGITIGYISESSLTAKDKTHKIKVKLSTDMASLHHVLVINNKLQKEQLDLENLDNNLLSE